MSGFRTRLLQEIHVVDPDTRDMILVEIHKELTGQQKIFGIDQGVVQSGVKRIREIKSLYSDDDLFLDYAVDYTEFKESGYERVVRIAGSSLKHLPHMILHHLGTYEGSTVTIFPSWYIARESMINILAHKIENEDGDEIGEDERCSLGLDSRDYGDCELTYGELIARYLFQGNVEGAMEAFNLNPGNDGETLELNLAYVEPRPQGTNILQQLRDKYHPEVVRQRKYEEFGDQ